MEIIITEQEKQELKDKILRNAEARMTEELVSDLRRSTMREVMGGVKAKALEMLKKEIAEVLTQEKIVSAVNSTLDVLKSTVSYNGGKTELRKELDNAILRVAENHAETVSKELRNLLFVALNNNFYNNNKKEGE